MNIAYIMRYWPVFGGGETITVSLANELVARGHSVHVFYIFDNVVNPMPYNVDQRIKLHKLNTVVPFSQEDVDFFHRSLEENQIDIMVNQWASTTLCDKARRGLNTKLVTCWHLDVVQKQCRPSSKKEWLVKHILGNWIYQKYSERRQIAAHLANQNISDKYVFLSKNFEKRFVEFAGKKASLQKLDSIANPLTYNYEYDLQNYSKKKKEVLFVGRILEHHKRLSYVLKIWKKIEGIEGLSDWRLRIVGDGPDMDQTKRKCEELRCQRVVFEGFKDPRPFYKDASVFVMTSAFEGFGMTLVEAQQYGTVPIAMNSYGSLHDIVRNGENGVIVANDNLNAFADELAKLMNDYCYRKRLAENGLKTCQTFSVGSIVNQWEKLFDNLICRA